MPHFAKFCGINFLKLGLLNNLYGVNFHDIDIFHQHGTLKFHANNDRSAKSCPATIKFLNFIRKICSFKENRDNTQHFRLRKVF